MAQETDVKCKMCGHTWISKAKVENITNGRVPCKNCGAKDLEIVQPDTPDESETKKTEAEIEAETNPPTEPETESTGEGRPEPEPSAKNGRSRPRTGGEIDAERQATSLKLAKAKAKLEAANAKKRAADRQEYLESELTDDEVEEMVGLEKRANCGNPHPPLFPEDMKRLADLRIRLENSSRSDI